MSDSIDALVIFGATGDLAKLETFPALVGLVERGVLEELAFAARPGSDMRPYHRLTGAALTGDRWLFARQDTVENAWKVVGPVLGDAVPAHPYARGSWGPAEAVRLLPGRDAWYDPAS